MNQVEAATALFEQYLRAAQYEIALGMELDTTTQTVTNPTIAVWLCILGGLVAAIIGLMLSRQKQWQFKLPHFFVLGLAFSASWLGAAGVWYFSVTTHQSRMETLRSEFRAWRDLSTDITLAGKRNRYDQKITDDERERIVTLLVNRVNDQAASQSSDIEEGTKKKSRIRVLQQVFGADVRSDEDVDRLQSASPEFYRTGRWMFLAPEKWPTTNKSVTLGDLPVSRR